MRTRYTVYLLAILGVLIVTLGTYVRQRQLNTAKSSEVLTSKDAPAPPVGRESDLASARSPSVPRSLPWIPSAPSPEQQVNLEVSRNADVAARRAEREQAAREERTLMSKTWKFTEEQHQKFEAAATQPQWDRKAVYDRLLNGDLPRQSFEKELAEADARDSQNLRDVLGSHYQEYVLMHGHFAEAGLDHKPFEPPVASREPQQGPNQ